MGRPYDRQSWRRLRAWKLCSDPFCEAPGCMAIATDVDHINGDATDNRDENLRSFCHSCHSAKTARHDGSFGRAPGNVTRKPKHLRGANPDGSPRDPGDTWHTHVVRRQGILIT